MGNFVLNNDKDEVDEVFSSLSLNKFSLQDTGISKRRLSYKRESHGYASVMYEPRIKSRRFEFRFKVVVSGQQDVMIGIGFEGDFNRTTHFYGLDDKSVGWQNVGSVHLSSCVQRSEKFGSALELKYKEGDVVGMIVDKYKENITLTKNGKKLEEHQLETKFYQDSEKKVDRYPELCLGCSIAYVGDEMELIYFRDLERPPILDHVLEKAKEDFRERVEYLRCNELFDSYLDSSEKDKCLMKIIIEDISFVVNKIVFLIG